MPGDIALEGQRKVCSYEAHREGWRLWELTPGPLPPGLSLPQLVLLDEATFVFVQNVEYLLHIIRALFLQTHHLEEPFVVEGVCSCWGEEEV